MKDPSRTRTHLADSHLEVLREERSHGADGADRPASVVAGRAKPRPAADQRDSRKLGQLLDLQKKETVLVGIFFGILFW